MDERRGYAFGTELARQDLLIFLVVLVDFEWSDDWDVNDEFWLGGELDLYVWAGLMNEDQKGQNDIMSIIQ